MTEKTLTTENIKPALDALRGELAPWPVVAKKQDRLNTAQLNAANSGITSSLVAQIIANTAAIRALESAITGTGLRALVVSSLPAVGTTGILYIVPVTTYDPDTDADVVNYSNEYLWIPVEGGTASEGHYEQVGQTGIVINNGQLNITVNGTSVGTFTANQSGDTTAAITVPTNADYVDLSTNQTVAGVKTFSSTINGTAAKAIADEDGTSIKTGYVNVAGNQTVSGNKEFTGSNTFNNILPNTTNSYSLGSSSYQWSSVYAQTYYYNGTQWGLDQPNTWSNINSFQREITLAGDRNAYVAPMWTGVGSGLSLLTQDASKSLFIGNYTNDTNNRKALDTSKGYLRIITGESNGENISYIEPINSSDSGLGTSTNKWKTLNGINPGALSLPDNSNAINLDTTNWGVSGELNHYAPTINGWLCISVKGGANNGLFLMDTSSGFGQSCYGNANETVAGRIKVALPVIASRDVLIIIHADSNSDIYEAKLYPCLGNV